MPDEVSNHSPIGLPAPLLDVQNLRKDFGDRHVLERFSLTVRTGEIVGLLGPNGSGKTTALLILSGLLQVDGGKGSVLELDLLRERAQIRRAIGYLPDTDSIYGTLTVRENLGLRAEFMSLLNPIQTVAATLDDFGLRPFETELVQRLPGGWGQVLHLAMALLHRPQLAVLDEPTAGLDVATRQMIWQILMARANAGAGFVMSLHDLLDANRCLRVLFLNEGRTRFSGRPSDLVEGADIGVLSVFGAARWDLINVLRNTSGVLTAYPSGPTLRVMVTRRDQLGVVALIEKHGVNPGLVEGTLEDAVVALSQRWDD